MNAKIKAYNKLGGRFPIQLKYFFYQGIRVTRFDFERIDAKVGVKLK